MKIAVSKLRINAVLCEQILKSHGLLEVIFHCICRIVMKFTTTISGFRYYVALPGLLYPVCVRWNSSDGDTVRQIFYERHYACLDDVENVKLVIDCGAYVGYSAIYFLNQFPDVHVIAVEPDARNYEIAKINLHPYKGRVTLIRSAIWSSGAPLKVLTGSFGDGREWATVVRECGGSEKADTIGIDIPALLRSSKFDHIDILKIDIEGSERELFSNNFDSWIDKVKNIAIELHGDECAEVFFGALSNYKYKLVINGEITACKAIKTHELS